MAHRELLAAGRRRATWVWRCLYFLVTLGICVWAFSDFQQYQAPSFQGEFLFGMLLAFMCFHAATAGVHATADAFGWEKREGTLGLLFLTDLSGWDVVAGKAVAKALHSFYGLLAMLPLLAVPLLLGGVVFGQIWRSALLLVAMMFQSLAVGLWVSSRSVNERKAIMATLGLILLLLLGPFVGAVLADEFYGWDDKDIWRIGVFSPLFGLLTTNIQAGTVTPPWPALTWLGSLGVSLLVTVGCLGSASRHLPHSWSPELLAHHRNLRTTRKSRLGWLAEPFRWPGHGLRWIGARREAWEELGRRFFGQRQRRLLDVHPYVWLCQRVADKRALASGVCAFVLLVWGMSQWMHGGVFARSELFFYFFVMLAWMFRLWMLAEPIMRLTEDRRSGALELVLVTPQQGPDIVRGIRQSMSRQFGGAVALLLGVGLIVVALDPAPLFVSGRGDSWRGLLLVSMVALAVDHVALRWIGPWLGLTSRSVTTGLLTGMGILVAPGVLWTVVGGFADQIQSGWIRRLQTVEPDLWRHYMVGCWLAATVFWAVAALAYRRFIWAKGTKWRWAVAALLTPFLLLTLLVGYKALQQFHFLPTGPLLREWTHWLLVGAVVWCWAKPTLERRFHEIATQPHKPVE